ncbi:MAG: HD domain-containing protein [Deltaproteobacteria bacterium]|nr:HD domain-containing protein [Deltaproteobacteria bacterium]
MKKSALGTALEWAAKIHFDQKWKNGKSSFLHHPLGVASLVLFYGGDEAQATAALLHDTIAANISTKEIEAQFGKEIANLVRAFEDPPEVSTLSNEWAQIKKAYLNKVKALPDRSLSVVLCEELHELTTLNIELRSLGSDVWRRYPVPGRDVGWYFRELLSIAYQRLNSPSHSAFISEFATQTKRLSDRVFEGNEN